MTLTIPQFRIQLQTVTPLFMAGAEPRGTPELRPPAFRGALRYWLRAALGGAIGDQDTRRLFEMESAVFGSAADGAGQASAVTVRLAWETEPKPQGFQPEPTETVVRNGRTLKQPSGRDYLYWSMKGNNQDPPKQFIPSQFRFDLVMAARRSDPEAPGVLAQAAAALWLLVHFGGLGSRARRTAGSLSAIAPAEYAGLQFQLQARSPAEVAAELARGLQVIRQLFPHPDSGPNKPFSAYDILDPAVCRMWVVGIWPTSEQAVSTIGRGLRDFRSYREDDHKNVAPWLMGQRIDKIERAEFGLPLQFRYSNGGPTGMIQGTTANRERLDRRASPLWLKVSRTASGQYVGVATVFDSQFLPVDSRLTARGVVHPAPPPAQGYPLIMKWLTETFEKDIREVKYA